MLCAPFVSLVTVQELFINWLFKFLAAVLIFSFTVVLRETEIFKRFWYQSQVLQYWYDTVSQVEILWFWNDLMAHSRWSQSCSKKSPNTLHIQHGNERFHWRMAIHVCLLADSLIVSCMFQFLWDRMHCKMSQNGHYACQVEQVFI